MFFLAYALVVLDSTVTLVVVCVIPVPTDSPLTTATGSYELWAASRLNLSGQRVTDLFDCSFCAFPQNLGLRLQPDLRGSSFGKPHDKSLNSHDEGT